MSEPSKEPAGEGRPSKIQVVGARVHNLKNVEVEVPLNSFVAIGGVSGSGKSSLALGVLYAEGSRRYIEALSTYTRRRLTSASKAAVDQVIHVPAALALRQRPGVPGVRSTFGTSTELLNVLRLMFSRLASHLCPNGHRVAPTINVAAEIPVICPVCEVEFMPPGAEALAFNSDGACPRCAGTGIVRELDDEALVPDDSKTIDEGAVEAWKLFGLQMMRQVVREFGVRTDVPFAQLTDREREVVFHGPFEKRRIEVQAKSGKFFELDFTYQNARDAAQEALSHTTSEAGLNRVNRFFRAHTCPDCGGTRLSEAARAPQIAGINLAEATAKTLDGIIAWVAGVPATLPRELQAMARALVDSFASTAGRLDQLGLGYLGLDRASSTLSTGERQRAALSRAVRNQTTGVLYVLDEPSIGLHPSNVDGLLGVLGDLLADGNSIVVVDHDTQVLRRADWLIELGPGSGADGGLVIAQGEVAKIESDPASLLGPFLAGREQVVVREPIEASEVFARGAIELRTKPIHTVHALEARVPLGRLTLVTGVSGSGKTTLVLEGLIPGVQAATAGERLPDHVIDVVAPGIKRVQVVDATPIGINVRSTVATYSGIMTQLRNAYAATPDAAAHDLTASDFSYNTGSLRCPRCEGTGQISLDVQFLPDVDITCPDCEGTRYAPLAQQVRRPVGESTGVTLPELMAMTAREALAVAGDLKGVRRRLRALVDLGLGYLTLGEDTPSLSGGEAQRLKLSTELHRRQEDTLFVLDEPSVGLHPLDVRTLLGVLDRLVGKGATIVVIEHDLDMIANADHVIDLGPGGGASGGRIVAVGTPRQLADDPESMTGSYLRGVLGG